MKLEVNADCGRCSALPPKCPDFCVLQRDWIENRFGREVDEGEGRAIILISYDIFCYDSHPSDLRSPNLHSCNLDQDKTKKKYLMSCAVSFYPKMDRVVDGWNAWKVEMTRLPTIHLQNISNFHGALWLTLLAEGRQKSGCSTKIFVDVDAHCI